MHKLLSPYNEDGVVAKWRHDTLNEYFIRRPTSSLPTMCVEVLVCHRKLSILNQLTLHCSNFVATAI